MTHYECIIDTTKANLELYYNALCTFSSSRDEALHYKLRAAGAYELAHDLLINLSAYDEKNKLSDWFFKEYCTKLDKAIFSFSFD